MSKKKETPEVTKKKKQVEKVDSKSEEKRVKTQKIARVEFNAIGEELIQVD